MAKKVAPRPKQRQPTPMEVRVAGQRASRLAADLDAAATLLERVERGEVPADLASPEIVARITRAWSAWRLHSSEAKGERGEFLSALKSGVHMVRESQMSPRDAAHFVLGFATYSHRVDQLSPDKRRKVLEICGLALMGLHRRRRHKAGEGPWRLVSEIVFLLWGESINGEALRVESAATA